MRLRSVTTILMTFAFLFVTVETITAQSQTEAEKPEVVAITMHADWCSTCKELNPKVNNLKPDFEDKGVLFTQFDFTDDFTIKQSRLMANWIGIGEIFQTSEERGATGYMLLLDGETSEVIGRITNDMNEDEIRQTIASLI